MGGNTLLQGVYVTVIGMGLVFLSLGILLLAMLALERLFRLEETGMVPPPSKEVIKEEERVAAIAVAIASALAEGESVRVEEAELGAGLREKASPWALLGRRGRMR